MFRAVATCSAHAMLAIRGVDPRACTRVDPAVGNDRDATMKPEVASALSDHAVERRRRLARLTDAQRLALLEQLIRDFFVDQRATLLKWSVLTGQSAQVDTGYIAQHMASVVLAEPGQGFKGKGVDLSDGSEVKSAAVLSGVDRPRWNHNMGTPADDNDRRRRGLEPKWEAYLASPLVFYVLFDRPGDPDDHRLRIRAWCVDGQRDAAWRDLVERFVDERGPRQYNMQLHPPVGYDDDIVVNTLGNLDFAACRVLEVRFAIPAPGERLQLDWIQPPSDAFRSGSASAVPYGGRGDRPSRIEGIEGHELEGEEVLRSLFPDLA